MANEILSQLFENQKIQMQRDAALRESLDSKVTNALSRVLNDDAALNEIKENIAYTIEQFNTLAHRAYSYKHTAVVTDDLEKDYQDIITANPDLENVSAVGLLAILSDGGTVTAQGNHMFINGAEEQSDYSFSGENSESGIEVVKIWYFQNGENQLTLQESFDYDPFVLWLKNKSTLNISDDYLNTQTVIVEGSSTVSANSLIKKIEYPGNTTGIVIPASAKSVKSNMTTLALNVFANKTSLQEVILPELTVIAGSVVGQNRNGFYGCSGLKRISFPKLQRIEDGTDYSYAFGSVISVELPDSTEYVGRYAFANNQSIVLNCPEAEFNDLWCYRAPNSFTMCSDWAASINISRAAAVNWSIQNFIDLMTNKLRDMTLTEETRTLTIPSAMLTAMQADTDGLAAIEAATDKGWTIGGA